MAPKKSDPKKSEAKKSGSKTSGKAKRSKHEALVDDLSTQVKKLAKHLKTAEKERDALGKKLDKHKAKTAEAIRAVEKKSRKQLKKAQAVAMPTATPTATPAVKSAAKSTATLAAKTPATSPVKAPAAPAAKTSAAPDDSWTVTRLRAEARAQTVAGYSRMTKGQLLAAIR